MFLFMFNIIKSLNTTICMENYSPNHDHPSENNTNTFSEVFLPERDSLNKNIPLIERIESLDSDKLNKENPDLGVLVEMKDLDMDNNEKIEKDNNVNFEAYLSGSDTDEEYENASGITNLNTGASFYFSSSSESTNISPENQFQIDEYPQTNLYSIHQPKKVWNENLNQSETIKTDKLESLEMTNNLTNGPLFVAFLIFSFSSLLIYQFWGYIIPF